MKASKLWSVFASIFLVVIAPRLTFAGLIVDPPVVPEPTALLVWAGLAGIGGLFFWRRQRDSD